MYYKYFDEETKMKFEEYLKNNEINPKEVYQKDLRIIQKLKGIFQEIGINKLNKGRCYFIKKVKKNESFLHLTNIKI